MKRNIRIVVIILIILSGIIIAILAINKHKINEANKPIDRSNVPVTVTALTTSLSDYSGETSIPAKLIPYEQANITVQTPGLISYLNIEQGTKVAKGQVLGSVDTRVAELNLKSTNLTINKLKDDYNRAKDLYAGHATTEVNVTNSKYSYDNTNVQAETLKQQIANARIISPISGMITVKNLRAGEFTNAGTPIASVVNISKLKAVVYVDENEVYGIKMNQSADVVSPVFPEKHLTGKVIYISPSGDENHNYEVDVEINNTPRVLRAGTDVNVTFQIDNQSNQIIIPKYALVNDRATPYVYVIDNNNVVKAREVQTGSSQGQNIVIVKGLSVGEKIVLSGQINLEDGSKVNIVK